MRRNGKINILLIAQKEKEKSCANPKKRRSARKERKSAASQQETCTSTFRTEKR